MWMDALRTSVHVFKTCNCAAYDSTLSIDFFVLYSILLSFYFIHQFSHQSEHMLCCFCAQLTKQADICTLMRGKMKSRRNSTKLYCGSQTNKHVSFRKYNCNLILVDWSCFRNCDRVKLTQSLLSLT